MSTSSITGAVEARRERMRQATVRELLDAAERQLAARPPGEVSLRAVARDVGITVQSVYHYFRSRDELLAALARRVEAVLACRMDAASGAEPTPAEQALATCRTFHAWALAEPNLFRLLFGGTPGAGGVGAAPGALTAALTRVALRGQDGPSAVAQPVTRAWAEVYGLVALQVFGLLDTAEVECAGLFADSCARIVVELDDSGAGAAWAGVRAPATGLREAG
jgi:AcrR family transcriptional regulator